MEYPCKSATEERIIGSLKLISTERLHGTLFSEKSKCSAIMRLLLAYSDGVAQKAAVFR